MVVDDVLAELDARAHAVMVERSLRQMRRTGARYAFLPFRLGERHGASAYALPGPGRAWSDLIGCGHGVECWQDDFELDVQVDHGGMFICLLELGHDGDHGYPDEEGRELIVRAFAEQVDPVRRIERRAMHAFEELAGGDGLVDEVWATELVGTHRMLPPA